MSQSVTAKLLSSTLWISQSNLLKNHSLNFGEMLDKKKQTQISIDIQNWGVSSFARKSFYKQFAAVFQANYSNFPILKSKTKN